MSDPAPNAAPPARGRSLVDPRTLMAIRNLELRAQVVVEGFWTGIHRSPYHGFSVEFTEYRSYCEGDDPRYLDWRLYARSDRYYIKKFEDETNLRCHLLVDNSRSMSYGSLPYTKAEYARTAAATLAYFLHAQGDAVGLMTFNDRICDYLPARNRPGHLRLLMLSLEKPAGGRETNLSAPLRRITELVRKRGLILLISDLLAPLERLSSDLSHLKAWGHEVILFQVLDPAELRLELPSAGLLYDLESERDLYIDPALARAQYLRRLQEHNDGVRRACEKLGIHFAQFTTDRPLELALFDFMKARTERGKRQRTVRAASA